MRIIGGLIAAALFALTMTAAPEPANAILCTYQGSNVSGLNRICFYNCAGNQAAITIRATDICPITINS